jgi:ATP-dependent 26S proteasome regulatory subunit
MIRSGRVELWLETRLPAAAARARLLEKEISALPSILQDGDLSRLVSLTHDFSGADLISFLHDTKGLVAFDEANGNALHPAASYFFDAALADMQKRREAHRQAEDSARARVMGAES